MNVGHLSRAVRVRRMSEELYLLIENARRSMYETYDILDLFIIIFQRDLPRINLALVEYLKLSTVSTT